VFTPEAERVRAFFRDTLGLGSVDAGNGWPIFAMPPAELAVHPSDDEPHHTLYLMCDDIEQTLTELRGKGVEVVGDVRDVRSLNLVLALIRELRWPTPRARFAAWL
jgi:hypothetical protein